MRAVVASVVALAVASGGCFQSTEHSRTIAKLVEGSMVVGGITMLAIVNTGADCQHTASGTGPKDTCTGRASALGNVGLGLLLAGLVGFVVTVSTSPDDGPTGPVIKTVGTDRTVTPAPVPTVAPRPITPTPTTPTTPTSP